jgi:transcriptional regulator GlxA family with amidase domain
VGDVVDARPGRAEVVYGARFVDDGDIVTAAGVTSGIDLALWLVERELGAEAAAAQADEIEWTRAQAPAASRSGD